MVGAERALALNGGRTGSRVGDCVTFSPSRCRVLDGASAKPPSPIHCLHPTPLHPFKCSFAHWRRRVALQTCSVTQATSVGLVGRHCAGRGRSLPQSGRSKCPRRARLQRSIGSAASRVHTETASVFTTRRIAPACIGPNTQRTASGILGPNGSEQRRSWPIDELAPLKGGERRRWPGSRLLGGPNAPAKLERRARSPAPPHLDSSAV